MYNSKYISDKVKIRLQRASSVGHVHSRRGKSLSGDFVHSYRENVMISVSTFAECSSLSELRRLFVLIQ